MPQTSCCISDPAPPTCRETTGDNGRQDHFRAQEADHTNQHPPSHMNGDNRRQWETTGDKTTSEPKKPTTLTNTHPHMKGDNRRQRETRPLQSPRSRPHQPTPTPHDEDNGRQNHFRAQDGGHTNQHPPPT